MSIQQSPASCIFGIKSFSFIRSINVQRMKSRQIINKYSAIDPCKSPATISKKSVSPSSEQTVILCFYKTSL